MGLEVSVLACFASLLIKLSYGCLCRESALKNGSDCCEDDIWETKVRSSKGEGSWMSDMQSADGSRSAWSVKQ